MDIVTGFMIWAAEASTIGVLLWTRWIYERQPFYFTWGTGFLFHGIGVGMVALRGTLPDFVSIEIANVMALGGIGLWVAGMLQFDKRRVEAFIAIPSLIFVAGMLLEPVRTNFSYRVALFHGAASVGYLMLIATVLWGENGRSQTRRVFAACVGVQVLSSTVVAIFALISKPQSFAAGNNSFLLLLVAALCFIAAIMSGSKLINERNEAKLKLLAVTDPLTNLLNRRGLIDQFHTLKRIHSGEGGLLALIHLDLDGFKQINDLYGHQAGDEVLVAFAKIGTAAQRGRGSFGRMGGEEFASIMYVANMIEAASVAEAIRTTLKQQPINVGDHQIPVTVSIGIALAEIRSANLDTLLSTADRALYVAKTNGRDRTAIGTESDVSIVPAIDHADTQDAPVQASMTQQVAALRRIVAIGK
ncbi:MULTISPECIES: GGDEF domain-containing protein [Rhizobiaceae]|uniref:diguanylate cyclase n=1 Tax=Aliirhizobium cellulosilyticum TaxID=393664 RepID=A0A7W6V3J3_9HYPH|nr:GGDEF domain-containing protein [Rhizobium cellulosilyticum]MBB4350354.1 diguanylate cyclase (GGDEF)-like protein [Rhizobium cellulosilyticum]MBB4413614.1 diguanylate cyclase (GGDEF)-like protein [Rhizobium cellulosilyticum]MBB4448247.1 diguanylate cyclase (GGDEF)-like protein [Rhizobium cellulosilyticum]